MNSRCRATVKLFTWTSGRGRRRRLSNLDKLTSGRRSSPAGPCVRSRRSQLNAPTASRNPRIGPKKVPVVFDPIGGEFSDCVGTGPAHPNSPGLEVFAGAFRRRPRKSGRRRRRRPREERADQIAEDFRAGLYAPRRRAPGQASPRFDRMPPNRRTGVERRFGQVERTERRGFPPKSPCTRKGSPARRVRGTWRKTEADRTPFPRQRRVAPSAA